LPDTYGVDALDCVVEAKAKELALEQVVANKESQIIL
jgi:hypothetical protein